MANTVTYTTAQPTKDPQSFAMMPVDALVPNPDNPRHRFDKEALDELAASIKVSGILEPLIVAPAVAMADGVALPDKDQGRFIIIAGHRRHQAAVIAGVKEVPVIVRPATTPDDLRVLSLLENLQRADLSPIEEAQGFVAALKIKGYTQQRLAREIGKSQPYIANRIRIGNLPEQVRTAVDKGLLSAAQAVSLATWNKYPAFVIALAMHAMKNGTSSTVLSDPGAVLKLARAEGLADSEMPPELLTRAENRERKEQEKAAAQQALTPPPSDAPTPPATPDRDERIVVEGPPTQGPADERTQAEKNLEKQAGLARLNDLAGTMKARILEIGPKPDPNTWHATAHAEMCLVALATIRVLASHENHKAIWDAVVLTFGKVAPALSMTTISNPPEKGLQPLDLERLMRVPPRVVLRIAAAAYLQTELYTARKYNQAAPNLNWFVTTTAPATPTTSKEASSSTATAPVSKAPDQPHSTGTVASAPEAASVTAASGEPSPTGSPTSTGASRSGTPAPTEPAASQNTDKPQGDWPKPKPV